MGSYDDYDPSDIPSDQAEPLPDRVPVEDEDSGSNPKFVAAGVPICPSDGPEGYSYPVPENPLQLPQKRRKSKTLFRDSANDKIIGEAPVTQSGISITDIGRVVSFHMPKLRDQMTKKKKKVNINVVLDGTLLPPAPNKNNNSMPVASMGLHDSVSARDNKVKKGHKKTGNKKSKKHKHNKAKKQTTTTTTKPTEEVKEAKTQIQPSQPRSGKNLKTPRKGKKAISVAAWLRRG